MCWILILTQQLSMWTNYLLSPRDYSVYKALSWGYCVAHYHKAYVATSCSQRIFHSVVTLIELIPVIGQIVSLFEMFIASLSKPLTLAELTRRHICPVASQKASYCTHTQAKNDIPTAAESDIQIELPEQIEGLAQALFFLQRQIESQYRHLPWPPQINRIVVLTDVHGGRGDVAAAAKAITIMQQFSSTLTFDWVLMNARFDQYDPGSFLQGDRSRIQIRTHRTQSQDHEAADFLLVDPVRFGFGMQYVEEVTARSIRGPVFSFLEAGEDLPTFDAAQLQNAVKPRIPTNDCHQIYEQLHSTLFPSAVQNGREALLMGLQRGSGLFLDPAWFNASLSQGYYCLSYLYQINAAMLRTDILEAMNVFDGQSTPAVEQHSFNSGYAHHEVSWGKFIDCVAIHEKNKHVVIVLNQRGCSTDLSTQQFEDQIFTPERLVFLKAKGYGTIILKGEGQNASLVQEAENPFTERRLVVIVRPSFSPDDMRCMQLASERLLATGNNSAAEAWCSRCQLYLYEDVASIGGCTFRFLQEQVQLAKTIYPDLGQLLYLFGGKCKGQLPEPFSHEDMEEIERLLADPHLSCATFQFCAQITANYSFGHIFEAAVKRAAWHHCVPKLAQIEANAMNTEFQNGLVAYLANPKACTLHVSTISKLAEQVKEAVTR